MQEVAVIKIEDQYPFSAYVPKENNISKILCHKVIPAGYKEAQRQNLIKKIKAILSHQFIQTCMMSIESVVQQQECVNVFYEYVHIPAEAWMRIKNLQAIQEIKQRVRKMSNVLACLKIVTTLSMRNLGVTENGQPKYYMQLDFRINDNLSKQHIRSVYYKNIDQMFEQIQIEVGKASPKKPIIQQKQQKLDMKNYLFSPQFQPDSGQSFIVPFSFKDNSSQNKSKQRKSQLDIPQNLRLTTRSATKANQACQQIQLTNKDLIIGNNCLYDDFSNSRKDIQAELLESVRSAGNYKRPLIHQKQGDQKSERNSMRLSDRQKRRGSKNQSAQDEAINRIKKQEYECLKNAKGSYYQDFANILDSQDQQCLKNRITSKQISYQRMQMSIATQDSQRLASKLSKQQNESKNGSLNIDKCKSDQIKGRVNDAINQSIKVIEKLRKLKLIKH